MRKEQVKSKAANFIQLAVSSVPGTKSINLRRTIMVERVR